MHLIFSLKVDWKRPMDKKEVLTTAYITGFFSKELEKSASTSWNPLEWNLIPNLPGGDALQNPVIAAGSGALLGAALEQLIGNKPISKRTLLSALIPGGSLGLLSYGAQNAIKGDKNET